MKKINSLLILLSALTLTVSACGQSVIEVNDKNFKAKVKEEGFFSTNTWTEKLNSKEPVKDQSFVQVGESLYSIGGDNSVNWQAINNVFDIKNNKWELKTPMSTNRSGLTSVVINNKIYVIGGFNGNTNEWLQKLEVYDTSNDTWKFKTSMPTRRSSLGATVINEKIYVVGGSLARDEWTNKLEEYEPTTDTWRNLKPMTISRAQVAVGSVNQKVYVIGGENADGVLNKVEEYNPKTNKWVTKADMPTARANAEVIAHKSNLIVMGGRSKENKLLNSVDIYNADTNTWISGKPLTKEMEGFGASTNDDGTSIYIYGGMTSQGVSDRLEMSMIEKIN